MELIYDNELFGHNPDEFYGEGSYRLNTISDVGTLVNLNFDPNDNILSVHTAEHLQKVKSCCEFNVPLAEVKLNFESYKAIYSSVRLSIFASENLDFAMTRPPGHHATQDDSKGFCFLNNIAIASKRLINQGKKVCIIDADGHHGDGTEKIFYDSNNLLFCSIFQENSYPNLGSSVADIGEGYGKGYNLNLPIPKESGDDILLASLDFYKKYIDEFNPDIVGISGGFDGYYKDKLLQLNYTLNGYREFGKRVKEFGYPLFGVLEGGYHEDVVSCANELVNGINGVDSSTSLIGKLSFSNKNILDKFYGSIFQLDNLLV